MTAPLEQQTDAEIVDLLQSGTPADRNAGMAEWLRRHRGLAFRVAKQFLGRFRHNEDVLQEAVQEAFFRFVEAIPRLSREGNARAYFLEIVKNAARRIKVLEDRHDAFSYPEYELGEASPEVPRYDVLQLLERCLRVLFPIQRELIEAYYLHGKTVLQLAEEKGTCRSTIANHINDGIRRMEEFVTRTGLKLKSNDPPLERLPRLTP